MKESCIIIPAVKKNVAFPDDLVKKLNGISLIERCINKAKRIVENKKIFVVTDSQEISLICKRNDVNYLYKQALRLKGVDIIKDLAFFLVRINKRFKNIAILWPYSPLLEDKEIFKAYELFSRNGHDVLTSVKKESHRVYKKDDADLQAIIFDIEKEKLLTEIKAFLILKSDLVRTYSNDNKLKVYPYLLKNDAIEIKNYQDWWICEKLLKRKRIIFRVIGYDEVGMGHIYRSLTLAREITDHEIIFACDKKSSLAANKIAGYDYLVEVFSAEEIEDGIISLKPGLIINDILDTSKNYILKLKRNGIKVVSFEDLGKGAKITNLTFNELYNESQIEGTDIKWGHKYFFLREEFNHAKPHKLKKKVESLLITFGGTDPHNLTQKTLSTVIDFCKSRNIQIHVVTGPGYLYKESLMHYLGKIDYKNIEFTYAIGVMSDIMEKTQIAISSNGRTVYELAHMNIPSIIISHHERENTHLFANNENGFINLGIYERDDTDGLLLQNLRNLVDDTEYRRTLFHRVKKYNFLKNKKKVVKMILKLIEK